MLDNNKFIKINLSNIGQNYLKLKSMLNDDVICSAVVKANAYGLGIKEVSRTIYEQGCKDFWVTNFSEAVVVKQNAPSAHIYIFQGINCREELQIIADNNFVPVISEVRQLELINNSSQKSLDIILNFDTGIGRDGLQIEEISKLNLKHCNICYIMSHLACAEKKNHFLNEQQLLAIKSLEQHFPGIKFTFANSAGIFLESKYHFNLARPGGALYGINPLEGQENPMLNVLEFKTSVLNRKIFHKSQYIGYSSTFKVNKEDKVLILNTGYYDGYRRALGNKSRVYVEGFYLPVIGGVSMNMIAIDANQLPDNLFFEIKNVELIGEKITIEEIAKLANADQREILTGLSHDCKRIYIK